MTESGIGLETYRFASEMARIANDAARRVQEENRRKGIPNVYSINGFLYYELPSGELSRTDPYVPPEARGPEATAPEEANGPQSDPPAAT